MTARKARDELAVTTPTAAPFRPAIAEVRLIGSSDVVDAAVATWPRRSAKAGSGTGASHPGR
jgi:hypothetical protein